jgi:ferredoxin-nitrite reductase
MKNKHHDATLQDSTTPVEADFSEAQKRYIEGFASGIAIAKSVLNASEQITQNGAKGPDYELITAQNNFLSASQKLADQENWKRSENPLDSLSRLARDAKANLAPNPEDNFRWRYHGMFYVAPTQSSFMCRLRLPNGIINHWQLDGLANLVERHSDGYMQITTRANLQARQIAPNQVGTFLEGLSDLGLTAKGAGADNIRNVTGSPTAGIDPKELLDTRPLTRRLHFHILNDRSLYGLPRKFNVAFDGGGSIAVLEETNDIGFKAISVLDGGPVSAGIWMHLLIGGITGHESLAQNTGVVCQPDECNEVADAIIRVFIHHGNRTDRNRARLKYLLDDWGLDKFLLAVEERLGRRLQRLEEAYISPRTSIDRYAHLGPHPQKAENENWLGVVIPVGQLSANQMRGLASIAHREGDGEIRLTVWQNLIIPSIRTERLDHVIQQLEALNLSTSPNSLRGGLVACTGANGCKFAAAETKGDALVIADYIESRLAVDVPINIHLTGCHHSCAQHYIGDIGLIAKKIPINDDGDTIAGYDIIVGGGFGTEAKIGEMLWPAIPTEECPNKIESILSAYLNHRINSSEAFTTFINRLTVGKLKKLIFEGAE